MPRIRSGLLRSALVTALLAGSALSPVQAEDAGAYLAARTAAGAKDYAAASGFYRRLLDAGEAPAEAFEAGLISELGAGYMDAARALAERMGLPENHSQIAALTLLAADVRDGNFNAGLEKLAAGAQPGPLVGGLYKAWAQAGVGQMSEAMKSFDEMVKEPGLEGFASYHKALALAVVGDYEGADAIFGSEAGQVLHGSRRGALAHVEILSQLERNTDAIALLDEAFGSGADPEIQGLRDRLEAGEMLPFTLINSPADGVAEVYFTVASALAGDVPDGYTLIHSRLATWLRPDHTDAILLSASLLEEQEQYDLAIATYAQIAPDSPAFQAAEVGRADALLRAEKVDAAIEVLENLTRANADVPGVWIALGDTLRREERYAEAAQAYDKAVNLMGDAQPADWFVWYTRAIAQERSDNWVEAEAGFRTALQLSPDQPPVLNYLAYSYLEKHQNLDEALDMISRAVAMRPDAGYIVDSLGWALFKLGRYDEAVVQMERAVELEAIDPVVNDHLGDVYWAVGRVREAEFQWKRALSFEASEDLDKDRVRLKLEIGLDQVLEREGAEPLKASKDAGN